VKKSILFVTILFLLSSAAFAQFIDLKPGHPAYPFVAKLVREGILEVGKNKRFDGAGYLNKYQLAVIMDRLYSAAFPDKPIELGPSEVFYKDLPSTIYANEAVQRLTAIKVFEPDENGNFNGNTRLTRYHFYYLFCRFIEAASGKQLPMVSEELGYSNISASDPYFPYLQKLIGIGLLPGGKLRYFDGELMINRMEMAIFTAKVLDYLRPEKKEIKPPVELLKPKSGYVDVPMGHFAQESIDELVEAGILPAGEKRKFYGDRQINKYELLDFTSKILEKLLIGEEGELPMADAALSYKDVESLNPAYRSIQKLIALGVLPPGNRTEILSGDLPVNRYQLAYYLIAPIEQILSPQFIIMEADPNLGYRDVSKDNFAYSAIQKLIWLNVLPGGADNDFAGNSPASRYDLAYFSVQVLKQLYLKIKEEEIAIIPRPEYGFSTYLNSGIFYSSLDRGKSTGEALTNIYGWQTLNLTINRRLNEYFSAYAYLQNQLYFGSKNPSNMNIGEAYLTYFDPQFSYQLGRMYNYFGFSPFGASLFFDNIIDQAAISIYAPFGNISSSFGKLVYNADFSTDSNFASLIFTSFNAPVQISVGGNLVTNILDPTGTIQLPSQITQTYGGVKINLFGLEAAAEASRIDYSDPSVLVYVGSTEEVNTTALQTSLTYYSPDYGYAVSLGYQRLGNDFYNGGLADPGLATYNSQGKDVIIFKSRFELSPKQYMTTNLSAIYQKGEYLGNVIYGKYTLNFSKSNYFNVDLKRFTDNTSAQQNSFDASTSISLSF